MHGKSCGSGGSKKGRLGEKKEHHSKMRKEMDSPRYTYSKKKKGK